MSDHSKTYAADPQLKWIYPDQKTPPRGVKLALLTEGGIQTTGDWTDDGRYIAWQKLFTRDKGHERNSR